MPNSVTPKIHSAMDTLFPLRLRLIMSDNLSAVPLKSLSTYSHTLTQAGHFVYRSVTEMTPRDGLVGRNTSLTKSQVCRELKARKQERLLDGHLTR